MPNNPPAKVLKYFFKPTGKPWNDPETYTEEEKKLHDDYVAYVNSQEGYDGNVVKTHIDADTLKHTYTISDEWKARDFAFNINNESVPVVNAYVTMMRNKSQSNNATNYTIRYAIEYANNYVDVVK